MSSAARPKISFATASGRWAGIGPYYAMFPTHFADEVIETYTVSGDRVLDPFAGRASSLFSASTRGREAVGMEINPVGWIYGQAKLTPAPVEDVESRIVELAEEARDSGGHLIEDLPPFFRYCFTDVVLRFLDTARKRLDWEFSAIDRTTMMFILVYMHGKRSASLSNQMRQSKAMSPDYSVRWWKEREMTPPDVDPESFLLKRIRWRYAKGLPQTTSSQLSKGNACDLMDEIVQEVLSGNKSPFKLLFTSPPYYGLTNYHYDQWLRLWMLGGPNLPQRLEGAYEKKFESKALYEDLLRNVFAKAARIIDPNGHVYVRTDAREYTFNVTMRALQEAFCDWKLEVKDRPFARDTQTALFGDKSRKPGEVDIILTNS